MRRIRTALLTDSKMLGDAFKSFMEDVSGLSFVGSVQPDPTVLKRLPTMRPTVVVVDTGIDHECFVQSMQSLQAVLPAAKCLGLNVPPAGDTVFRCADAGIRGFVMRDASKEDLVEAIRAVSAGKPVLPAPVAGQLLAYVTAHGPDGAGGHPGPMDALSRREREIVAGLAEGMTNKEIAQRLSIAPLTVKNHIHNILVKLSLHSRHQVARKAAPAATVIGRGRPVP